MPCSEDHNRHSANEAWLVKCHYPSKLIMPLFTYIPDGQKALVSSPNASYSNSMSQQVRGGAQHQHYVPRHILRGFLSTDEKEAAAERVRVFDLDTGRAFTTKIDNIMGERRYNDWWADADTRLTIEPAVGKIEDFVLPLITRLREIKRLDLSEQEHAEIALLLAFQFCRVKAMREVMIRVEQQFRSGIEKRGWSMDQIDGWRPLDEDRLKEDHVRQQMHSLASFTEAMADKVFFLAEPPSHMSLYIGDNPVVMANDVKQGPWGNLGLNVPFIQIYMPIAQDLLLCAYSKEVLGKLMREHDEAMVEVRSDVMGKLMRGEIEQSLVKPLLDEFDESDGVRELLRRIRSGKPTQLGVEHVLRCNALQALYAVRHVIDSRGDFDAARSVLCERQLAAGSTAGNNQ